MWRVNNIIVFGLPAIMGNCAPIVRSAQYEDIKLGSLNETQNSQSISVRFKCPPHHTLHPVFRVDIGKATEIEKSKCRHVWNENYSVNMHVIDSKGLLIFEKSFNHKSGNIMTNGSWFDPDITIILCDNTFGNMFAYGEEYQITFNISGEGIQINGLDVYMRRTF